MSQEFLPRVAGSERRAAVAKDKRVLLASRDVPGWGGACTTNYRIFEQLQRDGFDVACVHLVPAADAEFHRRHHVSDFGNPHRLDNVYTLVLDEREWQRQPVLVDLIEQVQPDTMMASGFIAAWQLAHAAPHLPLLFRTSGSSQLKRLLRDGHIADYLDFQRQVAEGVAFPQRRGDPEREAVERSAQVLLHSPIVRSAFETFFPHHVAKVLPNEISMYDWIVAEAAKHAHLRRPFDERDIDVLFVANDWSRFEKNYPLAQELARAFAHRSVHFVGVVEARLGSAHYHGRIAKRSQLHAILGRARVLVSTSLMDAAPGVLFEAVAMGCNVVASPNCGNWRLCPPPLLAHRCDVEAFRPRIERALEQPYAHDSTPFRGGAAILEEALWS